MGVTFEENVVVVVFVVVVVVDVVVLLVEVKGVRFSVAANTAEEVLLWSRNVVHNLPNYTKLDLPETIYSQVLPNSAKKKRKKSNFLPGSGWATNPHTWHNANTQAAISSGLVSTK